MAETPALRRGAHRPACVRAAIQLRPTVTQAVVHGVGSQLFSARGEVGRQTIDILTGKHILKDMERLEYCEKKAHEVVQTLALEAREMHESST